ncbi:cytochrome c biogenesis protein CcdA [Buchananella hordeovulneris]|uniref:Thiol:disulfide interchange protein n=1 Tax=Buchananella hordeovulneris TaxID=52770 RepID=A0A1Q5PX13_9ACTO|nr:cytochrome c biogenesis protein CcdA [Buchananella hordeovulneris]OKL51930.1 thiol:disulfide interchange protein [Buchananella hordeovulneris]
MTTQIIVGLLGGLITGISPCILPVLPVIFLAGGAPSGRAVSGIKVAPGVQLGAGATAGGPAPTVSRARPFLFVAGLVTSFTAFTLLGNAVLTLLGLPPGIIRWAGITLLFLIGVAMVWPRLMELLERPFSRFARTTGRRPGNGFWLGVVLGAVYVPCAGPVLAAVSVASHTGEFGWETVVLAVSFALGNAIPLLIFALAGRKVVERLNQFRDRQRAIRMAAGVTMVALAVGLVFDVPAKLQRLLPDHTAGVQRQLDQALHGEQGRGGCVDGASELANCGPLPQIEGIHAWFNTPGDQPADLKNKVTLIDFWAYSCINCQRTAPALEKLHQTYKDAGLVVVGVHAPEYAFEKDVDNVRSGAAQLGITYPVAVDSDLVTWRNFENRYWPAHYLADAQGQLRQVKFGEGGAATTEKLVRQLLLAANPDVQLPNAVFTTDSAGYTEQRSPEMYLGYQRARHVSGDPVRPGVNEYTLPAANEQDTFALGGTWQVDAQEITPAADTAKLRLAYRGRDVNLVVSGSGTLRYSVDGNPPQELPVPAVPNGVVLVGGSDKTEGVVELEVPRGAVLYSFTFGAVPNIFSGGGGMGESCAGTGKCGDELGGAN